MPLQSIVPLMTTMATGLTSQNEFHIAPMQCYTNQPFRKLCTFLSPSSVKWTEMEKVDDLLRNTKEALDKRLDGEQHECSNLVLQLGSNDVEKLSKCVTVATRHYPLKEINLNCGCPAIDTGGASSYGASLMKDTLLTSRLVESMVSASNGIDVSVKCRIVVFETLEDVEPMNDRQYNSLYNYMSAIYDAGANHVILHARPAILSMSPVKNRIIPMLDYDLVNRIAKDFDGKLKITLNGGINSLSELEDMRSNSEMNTSSYMSGRWCLRRPLDLIQVERTLAVHTVADAQSAIERYIAYATTNRDRFPMGELCLPLYLVVSQLQEDYDQDHEGLLSWGEIENLHDVLEEGLLQLNSGKGKASDLINFKKLAASFKPLVGTKVVNKWKRNRAEL